MVKKAWLEWRGGAKKGMESKKKRKWEKIKLREILSNPVFLGKTVRIGDCVFEVKGIDTLLGVNN
jgi:hypothetical protein